MPHPLLIFSQSDCLIRIVAITLHTKWQTVQIQISWLLQKPTDLDLHSLQRQGISGFSRTRVNFLFFIVLWWLFFCLFFFVFYFVSVFYKRAVNKCTIFFSFRYKLLLIHVQRRHLKTKLPHGKLQDGKTISILLGHSTWSACNCQYHTCLDIVAHRQPANDYQATFGALRVWKCIWPYLQAWTRP